MHLSHIVPWGRSFHEYRNMFNLSEADLRKNILGCGDGPASFNCELNALGGSVTSMDPLYRYNSAEISERIQSVYQSIVSQMLIDREHFHWKEITDPYHLGHLRMQSMQRFLRDFSAGKAAGRYREGSLPDLPFDDNSFDLALCSHLLFLYSDHLSKDAHVRSLINLCTVAKEVRVYPLLNLAHQKPPFLQAVIEEIREQGILVREEPVSHAFQKGAYTMLVAHRADPLRT